MKRFHVHVSVSNLPDSIGFYSKLFGAEPSVQKDDYAKWMLDDPRVNFAISARGHQPGVNHLGFQVESDEELSELREHVTRADIAALVQGEADCCYAKSNKYWVQDPQGIAWETFRTLDSIPVFGEDSAQQKQNDSACCVPLAKQPQDAANAACCVPNEERADSKQACCA